MFAHACVRVVHVCTCARARVFLARAGWDPVLLELLFSVLCQGPRVATSQVPL